MLVRRIARPLLASSFIYGGIDTLRNPQSRVPGARPVVEQIAEQADKQLPVQVPRDVEQWVKIDAGVKVAVLETTSHGIALQRVAGVAFDIAAYTNLTHEHLDFHGSLEAYREVKLQLAELARHGPRKAGVPKAIVFNADA